MKVAILLTGQMRRYTDAEVQHSLQKYLGLFDSADIFISTWSDRGVSHNHGDVKWRGDEKDGITEAELRRIYPLAKRIAIHDLAAWERSLEGCWKTVYTEGFEWNGLPIRGTVVPQLFGLWDANRLRCEYEAVTGARYDLVIRCRPDVVFAPQSRSLYESAIPNTVYAINCKSTGAYYPQRIYDIFFFGDPKAINQLCEAYKNLDTLVAHPWNNGLHPRDACRCLYVQARFLGGAGIVDLPFELCKVVR
jgi:hypothetical protein